MGVFYKVRKYQTVVSVFLFFTIGVFCYFYNGFSLIDIQLSYWGGNISRTKYLWNGIIIFLSLSVLFNSFRYIDSDNSLRWKKTSKFLFGLISFFLFMVGIFNIDHLYIHNIFAYLYFIMYPLVIFIFTYLNRFFLRYVDWLFNIFVSVIMIIAPLIFMFIYDGMAIAEILHIVLVIIWNLRISFGYVK